ncbi:Acetylornithine aminotransferase [Aliarcobacter thereius]|uniref:Acetylornithine aminotransferase n=1 Tax=Aliarcobacter thereius LMG 24486 TaxID=1032240 RepID=A0A1C7WNH4_9BACT|nr:aspartate aminotransferase family protein [Aliarcobacter thereius]OCL87664.1 Acetylornithine aminotransferase [Aliarcobacter thereius]OCL95316.1 Acetylornithine aminotransferase [Aliarcobacter thereius LMG 24486]QBF16695.1 N-succinyldiaminopimelate-aminotransferase / acetylornithine transaminase [Aliarcobacter thereius LMG 24486]TLS91470.1 aspartate aminotransferase family protein [Aliarcobacter thereius]TLT08578.1 aspartate aminotransferase family protein [Aliarcobacter thereius]
MKDIEKLDKEYVLHTYARNYVNFVKGENATLYDNENKDYIDFTSGIGVTSVGHGNKQVAKRIFEQVSNLTHTSNIYAIEPQALLAKKIKELSTYDVRTFFANSGAEANEGAIKIARTYGQTAFENKRYKIITLENSFHGRTITTVKATGQSSFHQSKFAPYPEGFSFNAIDDVYKAIDDETVAVMIELVQGEGGILPFPKEKIQELAKFLKDNKILLIIDEVQTGVYRTGEFLASNVYEIEPDIITLAKGLGGGVPIGAVMTNLKDIWGAGDHGSTFGGNYLVTSAGLEVLDILEKEKNSGKLDKTIEYFVEKMNDLYENNQNIFIANVGLGLMRGLRVKDADTLTNLIKTAFECGVMVLKSGNNTLRFLPALTISKDEIDEGFKRLQKAINKIA